MISSPSLWACQTMYIFFEKNNSKTGLSLRGGGRGFPPDTFIGKQKKNRTKRNPQLFDFPLTLFLYSFLSFFFFFFFTSHGHSSDKPTVPDKNTAVVGTLKANTVFSPSCAFLFPPNTVYCDSVTKSCTPTLGGREDTKVSLQF